MMDMPLPAHARMTLVLQSHVPLAAKSVKQKLNHGGDMDMDMAWLTLIPLDMDAAMSMESQFPAPGVRSVKLKLNHGWDMDMDTLMPMVMLLQSSELP
jgi:uncharacterized protein YqjF (DUF2071 family)